MNTSINWDAVGVHQIGLAKVEGVKDRNAKTVHVRFAGVEKPLIGWKESKYDVPYTEGAEAELTIEIKQVERDGETSLERWVKSFKKPGAAKGGGSPFKAGQPKDDASIAAQVIVKDAVQLHLAEMSRSKEAVPADLKRVAEIADGLTAAYISAYGKLKAVHGS